MKRGTKLFIALVFVSLFIVACPLESPACSMVKVTKNGKTIVGNNEEQMNPNTRIWFENGKNGEYGVVYVGFDNLFPQGGMNGAGLVFDGFTLSFKEVKNGRGKKAFQPWICKRKSCASAQPLSKSRTL